MTTMDDEAELDTLEDPNANEKENEGDSLELKLKEKKVTGGKISKLKKIMKGDPTPTTTATADPAEEGQTEKGGKHIKSLPTSKQKPKTRAKTKIKLVLSSASSTSEDDDKSLLPPECCEGFGEGFHQDGIAKIRMSVPWFRGINLKAGQYEYICFSESLLMVDEVGKIAGKMYSSVTPGKWGDQMCLCAHSGSFGVISEDLECGTTITGFVSLDMKTVQEYVYEWAASGGTLYERKTFIMKEEDEVLNVRIIILKDGEIMEQKIVNLAKLEQELLVTESTNIVLMRLLMMEKRTTGGMELRTLTFQGKVVKNKYGELGNGWENVKGEPIRVWSIRRTVEFDFGERIWDSMFNQFGRLVLRCQPENIHAMIPLWFEPVKDFKDGKLTGSFPPYVWACDVELHAKYLLKKDELAAEHRCYLLEHPELRALMSDFLQSVLLRKPPSIVPYAQQYFESFLKFRPETHHSISSSSSSITSSVEPEEWGEWDGEGNNRRNYYNVKPTRSDDGLEKLLSEEELMEKILHPDEAVAIGAEGKFITNFDTSKLRKSEAPEHFPGFSTK